VSNDANRYTDPRDLAAIENRLSRAIETVNDLARAHADTIRSEAVAKYRAKRWADIAYEMWALLVNSQHDGHGNAAAPAQWEAQKKALRERLNAALDDMPEDVKP
jgi:hypothetical protein